jgi:membrane-associated phospholipid phosphatase
MAARFKATWLFILLGFITVPTFAQQDTASHEVRPLRFDKYYIYSGILDARDQVVAPFHWNGIQWATFGVLAAGESALIFAGGDRNIQIWSQNHRTITTNFIENNIGDPFGDGLYPAILIGTSYIFGCAFQNDHLKKMAMLTAKSVAISGLTTFVIKSFAERDRPYQVISSDPLRWNGPVGKFSFNSFPSGHTTVAFATATSIALIYPHPLIIPVLAYGIATVTAMGRINGNFHWGSDVLMGAAIGYFTSRLVIGHNNWWKCLQHKKVPPQVSNENLR